MGNRIKGLEGVRNPHLPHQALAMDVEQYFLFFVFFDAGELTNSFFAVKDSEKLVIKPLTGFANIIILFKNGQFYLR